MLQFRYEELLSAPAEVQARIARALDLDFKVDFAEFHEHQANLPYRYEGRHAAVDQTLVRENMPVDRARAGKWRAPEHRQRIIDQFTRFPALFDLLIDTGYETDTTWFDSYREGNGQHPGSEHQ
jgi:hypothetical protein